MKRIFALAAALILGNVAGAAEISDADRKAVIDAVIAHLDTDYILPEAGRRGAQQLRKARDARELGVPKQGDAFAKQLTELLRESTGDGHLTVEYSEKALAEHPQQDAAFLAQENERYYGAHVNFGVKKAERLEGNIGLLELTVFPPSSMGGATVAAAMQVIAHTDALIIDLRKNGGGSDTVALVASYLFDEQQQLSGIYHRPADKLQQHYTQAYVPGAKFGGAKPVFVLTSKRTFSAAEALTYDLQALKRATVVGEPSGGGAHPFSYQRIHPHFVLWSVKEKSVNPITGTNWQGTGVQPDVRIEADKALEKALELIRQRKG